MAFGIGINTEHTEQEPLSGTYHEVAVQCWFTATGKSLPLMLKVKGEDEEIIQINHIFWENKSILCFYFVRRIVHGNWLYKIPRMK